MSCSSISLFTGVDIGGMLGGRLGIWDFPPKSHGLVLVSSVPKNSAPDLLKNLKPDLDSTQLGACVESSARLRTTLLISVTGLRCIGILPVSSTGRIS